MKMVLMKLVLKKQVLMQRGPTKHAATKDGWKPVREGSCHSRSPEDPLAALAALGLDSSAWEVAPGWREAGGLPRERDRIGG